jgi:hypothetical protein
MDTIGESTTGTGDSDSDVIFVVRMPTGGQMPCNGGDSDNAIEPISVGIECLSNVINDNSRRRPNERTPNTVTLRRIQM